MKKVCKILCLVIVVCLLGLHPSSYAKDIDSSDVVEIFNQGLDYFEKGDYENAIKDFNRALEINPKFAEAYNNRGNAYALMGDFERAIADFNRALEINPKLAGAYFNKGLVYDRLGRFQEAVKAYIDFLSCVSARTPNQTPGMDNLIERAKQRIKELEGK